MAAYSKAAQALIAPFGGLDVVRSCAEAQTCVECRIGTIHLEGALEELSRSRLGACCLIFIGTVCSAVFGLWLSHPSRRYDIDIGYAAHFRHTGICACVRACVRARVRVCARSTRGGRIYQRVLEGNSAELPGAILPSWLDGDLWHQ
eukprot:681583-Amphidinium_carterae.1